MEMLPYLYMGINLEKLLKIDLSYEHEIKLAREQAHEQDAGMESSLVNHFAYKCLRECAYSTLNTRLG